MKEATKGREGATGVTYDEFEHFIQSHPEYVKVFTDKLEKFG